MGAGQYIFFRSLKGFRPSVELRLPDPEPGALPSRKRLHTYYSVGCVPASRAGALTASDEERVLFL